jgi:hypothetical protein
MFRFVYAWQPGDAWESLAADGFVGVECDGPAPDGVAHVGTRQNAGAPVAAADGYVIVPPPSLPASAAGRVLRELADQRPDERLLVESGGAFTSAHALWTLMEATRHQRVGVALDLDASRRAGEVPSVLVPTLHLRIGLVRVHTPADDLSGYAKRLAGVGFDGWVVLDPPAGNDRPAAAWTLAATFREIFPAKPPKKAAVTKPGR